MGNDDRLSKVQRALRLAESDGDDQKKAELRENVGDLYLKADNYEQSLVYFRKIRESKRWHSLLAGEKARVWYKMASAHLGRGEFEAALRLAMRAERALEHDSDVDSSLLGKIHSLTGQVNRKIGNHQDALAHSLRALHHLRHSKENQEIAMVQLTCGSIFLRQGNFSEAVRYFQDSLSTYRRIDDEQGIAKAYNNLGVAYKNLCQWENATQALRRAMHIDHQFGNYAGVALRSLNLGIVQYQRGEWDAAAGRIEKSLQMSRAVGNSLGVTLSSLVKARMARHKRKWDEAKTLATDALRISSVHGNRREIAGAFEEIGAYYFDRGQYQTARTFFEKSLSVAREISERNDHIAEVNRRLSEVATLSGSSQEGIDHAQRAVRVAVAIRDKRLVGIALRALASACRASGDIKRAARYAGRSVRIFESVGIPFELGRSLVESAIIAQLLDDLGAARSDLTRAEAIFRRFAADTYSCRVLIEFARLKTRSDRVEDGLVILQKAERHLEPERRTEEALDIERLRSSIVDRFVECSLAPSNRFLLVRESIGGGKGILRRVVDTLDADRGFLFAKDDEGRYRVEECRGIDREEAMRLLEGPLRGWSHPVEANPMVSFGAGENGSIRSFLVAPVGDARTMAIYVDRIKSSGRGLFNRRDLNFLVGVARGTRLSPPGRESDNPGRFRGMITRDRKMQDILAMLKKLSGMHITILLQGETGTGKGILAYEISKENPGPFVTINCADLSETILESELFGHVKSAFTGASVSKRGLFEVADGGTVFIDEIDKTSRKFQEKLLRVVDKREFKPVGSVKVKRIDCRIVCASNRDLLAEVERGQFLQDLYYRLKVISIHLPPLRERRDDIPLLARHFFAKFSSELGKPDVSLSDEVLDLFTRYPWPGNVRDLENEIERAVALAGEGEKIVIDSLSDELISHGRGGLPTPAVGQKPLAKVVEEVEAGMISDALRECNGNKSRAARLLGLTRKGLRNKIVRYKIDLQGISGTGS